MRADQVDERRLAGAVRPNEREEFSLVDDEIHAVTGACLAELLPQVHGFEQDRHGVPFAFSLSVNFDTAPTIPVGSTKISITSTTPSKSCQYSVVATA